MQRLGPWLIVSDNDRCGYSPDGVLENATFNGVYTRMQSAGVGEAAGAADGVMPIGAFESMYTGKGSCGGVLYRITLWRTAETVVGRFHSCEGRDDGGLISQASYDQKTGHLTFTARLLFGNTGPAQDVFTFDGHLATTEVTGTLKHVNESHPQRGATSERITLKKPEVENFSQTLKSYPSLADWRGDQRD
jgi:hypothetical protein